MFPDPRSRPRFDPLLRLALAALGMAVFCALWFTWRAWQGTRPREVSLSDVTQITHIAFPLSARLVHSLYSPFAIDRHLYAAVQVPNVDVDRFVARYQRTTGQEFSKDTFDEMNYSTPGNEPSWWPASATTGLVTNPRDHASPVPGTLVYAAIIPGSTHAAVYVFWRVM
jgi:hypothetical protein